MKTFQPLTPAREIAHWRQFFRSRDTAIALAGLAGPQPRRSRGNGGGPTFAPTEWAETEWPDTCIDPPAP